MPDGILMRYFGEPRNGLLTGYWCSIRRGNGGLRHSNDRDRGSDYAGNNRDPSLSSTSDRQPAAHHVRVDKNSKSPRRMGALGSLLEESSWHHHHSWNERGIGQKTSGRNASGRSGRPINFGSCSYRFESAKPCLRNFERTSQSLRR